MIFIFSKPLMQYDIFQQHQIKQYTFGNSNLDSNTCNGSSWICTIVKCQTKSNWWHSLEWLFFKMYNCHSFCTSIFGYNSHFSGEIVIYSTWNSPQICYLCVYIYMCILCWLIQVRSVIIILYSCDGLLR